LPRAFEENVQKLHDESLTHGRDVLAQADEKDKEKWLAKDGTDWSLAFGEDPRTLMNKASGEEPDGEDYDDFDDDDDESAGSGDVDLGVNDADTGYRSSSVDDDQGEENGRASMDSTNSETPSSASTKSKNPIKAYKDYKERSRDLHRKHRGLMQWRPMRNAQFAKNEALFAVRRVSKLGSLTLRRRCEQMAECWIKPSCLICKISASVSSKLSCMLASGPFLEIEYHLPTVHMTRASR
jgi:hypothetical protein